LHILKSPKITITYSLIVFLIKRFFLLVFFACFALKGQAKTAYSYNDKIHVYNDLSNFLEIYCILNKNLQIKNWRPIIFKDLFLEEVGTLKKESPTIKPIKINNDDFFFKEKLKIQIILCLIVTTLLGLFCFVLLLKNIKAIKTLKIMKEEEKKVLIKRIQFRENELNVAMVTISNSKQIFLNIKELLNRLDKSDPQVNELKKEFKNLMLSGSKLMTIGNRVESKYPGIVNVLKKTHPNLSDTEIRYCIFTKLNLSTKETASILGVSPNTVKTSRSRIKKKMNVSEKLSLKFYLDGLSPI